jgi:aspartyl-tRNA(Asn)/glutamyl-tRNA(Gln) amidotransferase subunit A
LPDARDTMSLPYQAIAWGGLDLEPEGPAPGPVQLDAGWGLAVEPETRAAVQAAARRFEAAGAIVEPVAPFMHARDGRRHGPLLAHALVAGFPGPAAATPAARCCPTSAQWIARGADAERRRGLPRLQPDGRDARRGGGGHGALSTSCSRRWRRCRLPAEWASPTNDPARPLEHIAFTLPFNMSEQPALSIDCGRTRGGRADRLQIVGQRHDDLGVLRPCKAEAGLQPQASQSRVFTGAILLP